jgi:hypothetical protein
MCDRFKEFNGVLCVRAALSGHMQRAAAAAAAHVCASRLWFQALHEPLHCISSFAAVNASFRTARQAVLVCALHWAVYMGLLRRRGVGVLAESSHQGCRLLAGGW